MMNVVCYLIKSYAFRTQMILPKQLMWNNLIECSIFSVKVIILIYTDSIGRQKKRARNLVWFNRVTIYIDDIYLTVHYFHKQLLFEFKRIPVSLWVSWVINILRCNPIWPSKKNIMNFIIIHQRTLLLIVKGKNNNFYYYIIIVIKI